MAAKLVRGGCQLLASRFGIAAGAASGGDPTAGAGRAGCGDLHRGGDDRGDRRIGGDRLNQRHGRGRERAGRLIVNCFGAWIERDRRAVDRDADERAAGTRVREDFGAQAEIGSGGRLSTDRAGGGGGIDADFHACREARC